MFWGWLVCIIVFALVALLVVYGNRQAKEDDKAAKAVNHQLQTLYPAAKSFPARLVGGNHPILGSVVKELALLVSEDVLVAVDRSTMQRFEIPIKNVKAQVVKKPGATVPRVLLWGLAAFAIKDTVTVLDIEDSVINDRYTAVFKIESHTNSSESFVDLVNRNRYALLTGSE